MKSVITALAASVALSAAAIAADPAGPADKADSGSLSSGAKEAAPATKGTGENEPVGQDATSGASTGEAGSAKVPGTRKPATSDPEGVDRP